MPEDQTPIPSLAPAFELFVERAMPVEIGDLAIGGRRVHVPVKGGTAVGKALAGIVVGGSETLFERADGVAVVEGTYIVRSDEGAFARVFGHGYCTAGNIRMSLLVEADADGPLASLSALAFIAEALPGEARLAVMKIT